MKGFNCCKNFSIKQERNLLFREIFQQIFGMPIDTFKFFIMFTSRHSNWNRQKDGKVKSKSKYSIKQWLVCLWLTSKKINSRNYKIIGYLRIRNKAGFKSWNRSGF